MSSNGPTRQRIWQAISKRLGAIWHFLTEPRDAIREPELRRRARFLSSLLVVTIPLGILGSLASTLLSPDYPAFGQSQILAFIAIMSFTTLLIIAYALSRTEQYYTAGSVVALAAFAIGAIGTSVLDPKEVDTLLVFLATDVLLASLLLPLRGTVTLAIINSLAVLLLPVLSPDLTITSVYNVLIFVIIMSVLIVVSAAVHQRNLEHIEEQSGTLADLCMQAERHAEEMQRVKNRLEAILNSVGEGLVVFSLDGCIQQVNPSFEEQVGRTDHEVCPHHYRDLLLTNQMSPATKEEAKAAMSAGRVWRGETSIQRQDGTTYDAAVTIAPVRNREGEVFSFVASLRDITALKEVERMKDAFVANVSHELRTPITNLKLHFYLLQKAPPGKRHEYLATLKRETDRLHLIIEDVLHLSRLDQKRVKLSLTTMDLNLLAEQYVADRTPLANSRGLSLTLNKHPDLLLAKADEGLLGQVLSVLLTNALNYTPEGGSIVVSTGLERRDGKLWAGFSVADTGPGVPPDEQGNLFQRFFRGKAGRESGAPGTGLGLAIAKEIVDLHGGRIEAVSEGVPGKGTTFATWLRAEK
jgi:two-component system phosphate regulon sensor histidine kinase PhoR